MNGVEKIERFKTQTEGMDLQVVAANYRAASRGRSLAEIYSKLCIVVGGSR